MESKEEMMAMLYVALIESVNLEMEDGFDDRLEHASNALKRVKEAAQELIESLEAKCPVECINKFDNMKETYWVDGKVNRVKFFNDVEVMLLNTKALLDTFTQYTRNNALLLAMGGTQISFSIKGNPLLPDVEMKGFNGEETS